MLAARSALAEEFLTLDARTKETLIDLATRLLPDRERLGQAWLSNFQQSAETTPGLKATDIALVTEELLRLFFDHAPGGDFDGYYQAVLRHGALYQSGDLPHGLLMLALHQFEQAALPFLSAAFPQQQQLHSALMALDRLCDNAIVLIASSYFETILAELRALQQVTDTALSTFDLEKLMQSLVQRMAEAVAADCGTMALRDEVSGALGTFAAVGLPQDTTPAHAMRGARKVVEHVIANGEAIQVSAHDTIADEEGEARQPPVRLYFPLRLGVRVTGVACLGRHRQVPFNQRNTQLVQLLAERAAAAIDHAQLYRRTARLLRQTEALQRVTASITSKMALLQVLEVVIDGVVEIFGALRVAIYLEEKETGELRCPASRGISAAFINSAKERRHTGLDALWTNELFYSPDVRHDERLDSLRADLLREGIGAILVLPFGRNGETRGALCLFHDGLRIYSPEELTLGQAFADQAAIAIANAALYREIREHAAELDRVNSELKILDRMKVDFLAMISHELRTPLTAILGYTDLLLRGARGDVSERQSSDLKTIRTNGQRLLTLINDLIDFSSIEAGRTALVARTLQISQTLPHALEGFAPLAESRSITLLNEVPPDLPRVVGDAAAVEKVVAQLLSNAIKFTGQGGTVVLRAGVGSRMLVEGQAAGAPGRTMEQRAAETRCVTISVVDTGIGIPAEQMTRIWDYFYQVDSSSARRFGGTGLGLAIAKRLVEMQGGSIWAESEGVSGKGSSFAFALRIAPEQAEASW